MCCVERRGAVAVESAIVCSLFLFLIFGLLDLSLAVLRSNATEFSANKLAREFSIQAALTSDDPLIVFNSTGAETRVSKYIASGTPTIQLSKMQVAINQSANSNSTDDTISIKLELQHDAILPALTPWKNVQLKSQVNHLIIPVDSPR